MHLLTFYRRLHPMNVDKDIFYVEIQSNPNTTVPINLTHMKINIFKYDRELKRELNLVTTSTQAESFFANNVTWKPYWILPYTLLKLKKHG